MFFPFNRKVVKEFLQGKEHFNNIYLAFDTWRKKWPIRLKSAV
jgi:hypothetical protein